MASNAMIDSISVRGYITEDDVVKMQRAYFSDVSISEGEVDELMEINASCSSQTKSWTKFFAETIAGFILQQTTPDGRISEGNAKWLASRIARNGEVSTAERAVLKLIKGQLPNVDPVLKPLLDRVA
jgi:hypothetical protein